MGAQFVGRFSLMLEPVKDTNRKLITSQNQSGDRNEDVSKLVIEARL